MRDAIADGEFGAGPFLERLDVHFANLFFEAYATDLAGAPVPAAWAPLFEGRTRADTHPVQYALAGMNAHISHDLPLAVVLTCRELAVEPGDGTPEHVDFSATNHVLEEAQGEIRTWFSSGLVARLDELGVASTTDSRPSASTWRAPPPGRYPRCCGAWPTTRGWPPYFRSNLGRSVGLASRGILL